MKNSKLRRVLMLLACAVMIVSLSVGATLAYLTATTKPVINSFTVGNVSFDDGEVGNDLDEAKVDQYGVPVQGADRVTENSYKLVPGHKYTKDPTVHIGSNSEDGYLFVRVENGIADIEAADVKDTDGNVTTAVTIATQMVAKGWIALNNANYPNVYYKAAPVKKDADVVVFESFTLKDDIDQETLKTYANKTITIQAYLVQADGFESATDAWTAAPLADWAPKTNAGGIDSGSSESGSSD